MENTLERIALCVEVGKINAKTPYPPAMKGEDGADELTQAMVQELIEKVVVTDPEHVEIVWKFKDEVRKFIGI